VGNICLRLYLLIIADFGYPVICLGIVLWELIKEKIGKLYDIGVIVTIQGNPYMQFFLVLREFIPQPVFDPSLFVEIRKRPDHEIFNALNVALIKSVIEKRTWSHKSKP